MVADCLFRPPESEFASRLNVLKARERDAFDFALQILGFAFALLRFAFLTQALVIGRLCRDKKDQSHAVKLFYGLRSHCRQLNDFIIAFGES